MFSRPKIFFLFLFSITPFCFAEDNTLVKAQQLFDSISGKTQLEVQVDLRTKYELITYHLINDEYYFSALLFAKQYLADARELPPLYEKALEKITLKVGIESLTDLNVNILKKFDTPTLNFAYALKSLRTNSLSEALHALEKIPVKHRFYPEAIYLIGTIYDLQNKNEDAINAYLKCIPEAESLESQFKKDKLKRYYALIKEKCTINQARISYRQGQFLKATEQFDKISKQSYLWPELLMEKAWTYYKLGDFNKTLGLLVTYKSPLLDGYFYPEGEVLNALSYLKLCLYQDALTTIDQYYKVYRPRSEQIRKIIESEAGKDPKYYIQLLFETDKNDSAFFLKKLSTQIKKMPKFSLDYLALKKAEEELDRLAKLKETTFLKILKSELSRSIDIRRIKLAHYVKSFFVHFINNVYKYSHNLFDIQLEIMSKERKLVYRNTKLIADRARGDFSNVQRKEIQMFWNFKGAFWADELGDYSFGLKSNCEEVKVPTVSPDINAPESTHEVEVNIDDASAISPQGETR